MNRLVLSSVFALALAAFQPAAFAQAHGDITLTHGLEGGPFSAALVGDGISLSGGLSTSTRVTHTPSPSASVSTTDLTNTWSATEFFVGWPARPVQFTAGVQVTDYAQQGTRNGATVNVEHDSHFVPTIGVRVSQRVGQFGAGARIALSSVGVSEAARVSVRVAGWDIAATYRHWPVPGWWSGLSLGVGVPF